KLFSLFVIFIFFQTEINAQVCTGALGDPVINIDFGRGSDQFGPPIAETTYAYVAGSPNDGHYTIVKTSAGQNTGWHQNVTNRTPNDPDGYFMLVNADINRGTFYQKTIQVCENTTYEFGAWVINMMRITGIKPNIKFAIAYNSTVEEFFTNDIPEGEPTDWKQYTKIFTTPRGVTSVTLKMTNENPGGAGNDLGIDDITFRVCGPIITGSINNAGSKADLCEGNDGIYDLSTVIPSGYNNPVYQWQENINGVWTNINGQTSIQTTVELFDAIAGLYQYRLSVTEQENIGSPLCGVFSEVLTIRVTEIPNPIAVNNSPVCFGATVNLFANNINLKADDDVTYNWVGPNNFSSALKDPIITNAISNGTYTLTVNINGCIGTSQTQVQVKPQIVAVTSFDKINICDGESIELKASGGNTYRWSPTENVTDVNISNPIVSPKKTTTYTVVVGVDNCFETRNITVNINPKTEGNAGADKRILAGQSVQLNGSAIGSNISFSWSPTDYLDDPTILNPIAT
ncbi:MAG: hypothetical protein EOO42_21400, partial [Flavobacteriales bacterium]